MTRPIRLVLLAAAAHAWTPLQSSDGTELSWPDDAWPLTLAEGGATWSRAAATWTQAADVGFAPAVDGRISLRRIEDPEEWASVVGDPGLVAFTLVSAEAGVLVDADVVLNAARFRFADPPEPRAQTTETVLLHELGHVLGLGHSCGDGGAPGCFGLDAEDPRFTAVMFPSIGPGELRAPGADDVDGLAARVAYPLEVDRPVVDAIEATGPGRWRVNTSGDHLLRIRRGDTLVGSTVEEEADWVLVETDEAGPLTLEVWSAAGQGWVGPDALESAPVGLDAAPVGADGAVDPPTDGDDDGCAANGLAGSAMLWLALAVRRRE